MTRIGSSSAASSRKPLTVSVSRAPLEIIGAEGKMAISAVNAAGSEGTCRIEGQMHLQGAAGEPSAGALEGRPLNDPEAEKILIESERPR